MFQPIGETFLLLLSFIIIGFCFGIAYEILRTLRLCVKTHRIIVDIEDILFFCLCAVVCFAFSMELGDGSFRLYYLMGTIFGGAAYFLTLGRLFHFLEVKIIALLKRILSVLFKPIRKLFGSFFYKIRLKISKIYRIFLHRVIFYLKRLLLKVKLVYNKRVPISDKRRNMSDNIEKGSGERNVIHASVSKKT